ncbi:MAG TPA: hypothetical protein VM529_23500 [Gemmata sp.]|nr:hypothetical protein [Gemmata sp.]
MPALAACHTRARGLELLPVASDRVRYPGCAEEKGEERLSELADAVVVVGEVPDEPTRRLSGRLSANGARVLTVGHSRTPDTPGLDKPGPHFAYTRLRD